MTHPHGAFNDMPRWAVAPATDEDIRVLHGKLTGNADQQLPVLHVMSLINRIRDDGQRLSDVTSERDEAQEVCGELYQVMAILAIEAGRFSDPDVIKALDNASDNAMTHKDVLPFASKPTRLEELERRCEHMQEALRKIVDLHHAKGYTSADRRADDMVGIALVALAKNSNELPEGATDNAGSIPARSPRFGKEKQVRLLPVDPDGSGGRDSRERPATNSDDAVTEHRQSSNPSDEVSQPRAGARRTQVRAVASEGAGPNLVDGPTGTK